MCNVKFFSAMTPAQRVEVTRATSLKDMEKGSLLEIHSVEMKTGEYGAYGIASYSSTLKNGARLEGTVRLTSNATQQADMVAPCVLLYTGTKLGKHGKAFYDVHVVPAPSPDPEEHQKFADGLRAMASSALLNYMTLMSLERFDVGAVILFKDMRKKKLRKDSGEDHGVRRSENEPARTLIPPHQRRGRIVTRCSLNNLYIFCDHFGLNFYNESESCDI